METLLPQQQADQLYRHLLAVGTTHELAVNQAMAHIQSLIQQTPTANTMQQGDQLTNNANQQHQGHGTASAQFDNDNAHD